MKKVFIPFFSFLLVLTLLLGSFGSAKAEVGDDPVVTPVSGDMEFTTEVIPIASLPGTTEMEDLMLVPVGFPLGEAQFEGAGVLVTKFDTGKANACFTISGTQYGWGGKVGVWDGTKWVLLPTVIKTTGDDGTTTTACATMTGNGTYAFIKYVVDVTLLPTKPLCEDVLGEEIWWMGFIVDDDPPMTFSGPIGNSTPLPWVGATISWRVINSNYPMGGVTSGSQVIDGDGYFDFGDSEFWWLGPDSAYPIFTIRLDTPFCYQEDLQEINWFVE